MFASPALFVHRCSRCDSARHALPACSESQTRSQKRLDPRRLQQTSRHCDLEQKPHAHHPISTENNTKCGPLNTLASSPIRLEQLEHLLAKYPNTRAARVISQGLRHGFRLEYTGPRETTRAKKHSSAITYSNIVVRAEIEKRNRTR